MSCQCRLLSARLLLVKRELAASLTHILNGNCSSRENITHALRRPCEKQLQQQNCLRLPLKMKLVN